MNTNTQSFYNNFSFFYPLVDIFLSPQKKVLLSKINQLPPGQLLEIGVGNGSYLPSYKMHRVTGIDVSIKMLKIAAKKKGTNTTLLQMNGETLLFENETFDYVVLSHVLAVVDDREKVLNEAYRVLKPNGRVFILNHFTPGNLLKYIDHMLSVFAKLFKFRSVFYVNDLVSLEKYKVISDISFGRTSYFKLLILEKK